MVKSLREFNCKPLWLTLIILMMFTITQINIVSAFEFDNVISYKDGDKTALFENAFGLPFIGKTIARATLDTPQINYVTAGKDRRVMIFTIENYDNEYSDGLKDMEIYNMQTGKYENKDFHYEYKEVIGQTPFDIVEDINCDEDGENCESRVIETRYQDIVNWKDLDTTNIPKGNITIALVTDVEEGDHYDGIPILFGKRVGRWAEWSAGLSVGLKGFYNMSSLENTLPTVSTSLIDLGGTEVFDSTGCLLNNCLHTFPTKDSSLQINKSIFDTLTTTASHNQTSINVWFKKTDNVSVIFLWNTEELQVEGTGVWSISKWASANLNTGAFPTEALDEWVMFSLTRNDTHGCSWLNATIQTCAAMGHNNMSNSTNFLSSDRTPFNNFFNGSVDELSIYNRSLSISEIIDLYNSGLGLTFVIIPVFGGSVTLNSPDDNFQTIEPIVNFSATITATDGNVTNTTLYIWHPNTTLFKTNFSIIQGISNQSNLTLGDIPIADGYLWSYEGCFSNITDHLCSFGTNRTFNRTGFTTGTFAFNETATEGTTQHYDVSFVTAETPTSVTINYNGTHFDATLTNTTDRNYVAERELTLPLNDNFNQSNNTFFFQINSSSGSEDTDIRGQIVNVLNLTICNPTNTIRYVNFSFRNETTSQEVITATASTSWNFWIDDKTINRTLTFTSSVEAINYSFCFDPPYEDINVDLDMIYNNAESQQRSFQYS